MRRPLLPLLVSALVAACGGIEVRPAADIQVVASPPSPEVEAFVEAFLAGGASAAVLDARLRDALRRYPTSGALHEIAGYWSILQADDHAAWEHFLLAAADTHNPHAALDIAEVSRVNRTRSEVLASLSALERIAAKTPDPLVRARAQFTRAAFLRGLGRAEEARDVVQQLGFVHKVMLLGAFDNEDGKGLAEAYAPESGIHLDRAVAGSVVPVSWRTAEALDAYGTVPLHARVFPNQGSVAYAAFWVLVPVTTVATLRISTEVPVAAWINGGSIVRDDHVQRWGFDNVTAATTLSSGWNEVLVKSAVKTGAWNLGVRITDAAGDFIPGLVTSTAPQVVPLSATSTRGKAAPAPASREEPFFAARRLVLGGLHQPGLARFEQLLSRTPESRLARFFTADAASHDRQLERALDLLSSGITDSEALPGFLSARAHLYLEKELLTQAQRDLVRVVDAHPTARLARLELADVLSKLTWQADRVAVLSDVTRRWPDSAAAFVSLGAAREAQGYQGKAEEAYRRAIALEPGAATPLRAMRRLLESRQASGEVDRIFERLAEANPVDVSDQLARAEHERTGGHPKEATALLTALSGQSPDHPTPYLHRGQIAEELGDLPTAIAMFQKAEERDPKDSWLAQRLEHLRPKADDPIGPYVATDEQIESAVRRATVKGDTASHVETLLSDTATLLSSDGSIRTVVTEVLRALTQRGRDELVHMGLAGGGAGGAVRVMKAYAETADGKRQDASSVEKTSIRFRNLEVGSTVVLQYAGYPRRTGALADDFFQDMPFSALGRHIDRMRWVVVASTRKPILVDADSRVKEVTNTKDHSAAWEVHEFVREDVPAIPAELSMVPVADLEAHVVVTTVPTWDSFIRWEKAILDESFPVDPAIDALAARLTSGATTPKDKLARLFAYTAQEIRYQQEYESILAGWQPHRSSVVLERKYGDCKDKATLLIALARAVDVEVHFVVLATHQLGHPDRKVVLPRFNHAIAYVPAQAGIDEPFFLDTTVDALDLWNLREDDQGAAGLVLDPKSGAFHWTAIPYQPPSFQKQSWQVSVEVTSPEKVTATSHLQLRGSHASSIRTLLRSEDQSRQVFDVLASAFFPGARVLSATAPDHESVTHPLSIDEELDLAGTVRQEGEHFRLKPPNDADSALTRLTDRQTPLELGAPKSSHAEIVLHFGKGVRVVEKPAPVEMVDPCFKVTRRVVSDAGMVTLTDDFEETCTEVSVADYPRFRAAMNRARSLLDAAVVFDRVSKKNAQR